MSKKSAAKLKKSASKAVRSAKRAPIKKPAAKAKKPVATKKTVKKIVAKKPVAKKIAPKAKIPARIVKMPAPVAAKKPVQPQQPVAKAAAAPKQFYKVGNYVVYPTHGVGKIMAEETQMIGEHELRLLVIHFEKDKMTLRVPMSRAAAAGLRPISGTERMKEVFVTLRSKAKISRGMWSRRAQEYETKINSGNIILISEVVRDLHQNVDQSERSYSERMIYENALNRLVGELAAAEGTDQKTAHDKLMKLLRGKVAAAQAAAAAAAVKEAA